MDISPVSTIPTMDLANLPEDSKLYGLLAKCQLDHEIVMVEAHDGALILNCFDCPFKHVLDEVEETHLRADNPQIAQAK